ncbi:MAG: hypothetical protein QM771_19490 [Nitrospira sp.]
MDERGAGLQRLSDSADARATVSVAGRPSGSPGRLGRAALPLIASDAVLQGARYLLILYLGYQSLSLLGSFLMGSAAGSLIVAAADFGISQHWLRLGGAVPPISAGTFLRTMRGKILLSLLGMFLIAAPAGLGLWTLATPSAMVLGMVLMVSQALGETCDAVALSAHRYGTVLRFRLFLAMGGYLAPVVGVYLVGQAPASDGAVAVLVIAAIGGIGISCAYLMAIASTLSVDAGGGAGYRQVLWQSRWLGLNQMAIVVDVRAPLIILGFMLGETAVGVYGLVQRTTAVVELVWASISRLLITSYSELGAGDQVAELEVRVWRAARLAGLITGTLVACMWFAIVMVIGTMTLSNDAALALSLLKVGSLAIVLSSLKRPFVSGLIAIFQERAVCRVNVLSALAGLFLVPVCIVYLNLWGPVVAWLTLEAAACALLVFLFVSVIRTAQANREPQLPQRAAF